MGLKEMPLAFKTKLDDFHVFSIMEFINSCGVIFL